jgi:DNA-binding Xre family transcriptional regulator
MTGKLRTDKQQYKEWQIMLAEKEMSVYRLAKDSGISYSTVLNAIKRDIGCMQIETAIALCDVLGLSIDELIRRIRYKD